MPWYTMVSQIKQAELSKISRKHVVAFKVEYEEYFRLINTFNSDRTTSNKFRLASLRKCMKGDLLENIVMTWVIEDVEEV